MKQISAFVKNIGTPNKNDLSTDEEEQQQGQKQRHDGSSECSETIGSEVDDNVNVVNVLDPPITVGKEGGILTAVRIRPLNTREIGSNSRIIVSNPGFMSQGIQIINPIFFKSSNQTEKLRKLEERGFSFDHTFWSLDGGNGVDKDEYASQEDIYDRIGKPIIQHAMSGFNCSLFAYGRSLLGYYWALGATYLYLYWLDVVSCHPLCVISLCLRISVLSLSDSLSFSVSLSPSLSITTSYIGIYNVYNVFFLLCLITNRSDRKWKDLHYDGKRSCHRHQQC